MQVHPIQTTRISLNQRDLLALIDAHLHECSENSVLAITSKIVSICQGRTVQSSGVDRQRLIESESDLYLPPSASRYGVTLTIKENILSPNAGIDESNGDGYFILWPENPQKVVNSVRQHLCKRFGLRQVGVILTDSSPVPLRWGVNGVVVAHSGFAALNDYRGKPDLFGRALRMTTVNVANALAVAAVLIMGEGSESTPMALISDLPFVQFQSRNPSKKELAALRIDPADDLYAPLLTSVAWQKGG